jgi:hypothetical protein
MFFLKKLPFVGLSVADADSRLFFPDFGFRIRNTESCKRLLFLNFSEQNGQMKALGLILHPYFSVGPRIWDPN